MKHRVLIVGDSPFINTGFAYLTREIGKALHEAGHTVGSVALWDRRKDESIQTYNEFTLPWKVWGCRTDNYRVFTATRYREIVNEFKPTLVIAITDIWIARPFLGINVPKIFYFHVEGEPIPVSTPGIREQINWIDTILNCEHIAFAGPFGKETTFKRINDFRKTIEKEMQKIAAIKVTDAMTHNPITVGPETGIESVAGLMVDKGFHTLPVVEDNKLVGVVGMADILKTIISE